MHRDKLSDPLATNHVSSKFVESMFAWNYSECYPGLNVINCRLFSDESCQCLDFCVFLTPVEFERSIDCVGGGQLLIIWP